MTNRLGVYVDGFNLYHGIAELDENFLKWLNLRLLSERVAQVYGLDIEKITYFTATNSKHANSEQKSRHQLYINALSSVDVKTVKGIFSDDNKKTCPNCKTPYKFPEEKQTDVNIALYALQDIAFDKVDHVMLVTGDSDQVPTFDIIKRIKPSARRIALFPPKRTGNSLKQASTDSKSISILDIEYALFKNIVLNGDHPIRRPNYYNPPEGWVHPAARPRK